MIKIITPIAALCILPLIYSHTPLTDAGKPSKVEIEKNGNNYLLSVNGSPYYIKERVDIRILRI